MLAAALPFWKTRNHAISHLVLSNDPVIHLRLSSITSMMEYASINNLHGIFKEHLSLSVEKNSMCRIGHDSLITCFTKLFWSGALQYNSVFLRKSHIDKKNIEVV
jgi:hypothetical protein